MDVRFSPDPVRYTGMSSRELRENFLIESLFRPGEIAMVYSDLDRAVVGSVVPTDSVLALKADAELRAEYFAERREIGILNVGAHGSVEVDGKSYELGHKDGLYVGRGAKSVSFKSTRSSDPAAFYVLSYPAHASYPTTLARQSDAAAVQLGSGEEANRRTIYKYIHPDGIRSCQLVMGFTELASGSVWNTMPPHTHTRRMEVYFYFDMKSETRVIHLMGKPEETRHLVIANRQAVLSPSWSIHAGAGTGPYAFCWGMGGENQAFADMDGVSMDMLR